MSPPIANAMNDAATVTPAQLATLLSFTIKAHEPVLITSALESASPRLAIKPR